MTGLKTVRNSHSAADFIAAVEPPARRADCVVLDQIMRAATGHKPVLWGPGIIGYGSYHYVYASGREGDWMLTGFAPRKRALTIYIMPGFEQFQPALAVLGKHRLGRSCLYLNSLAEVDQAVLSEMIRHSVEIMSQRYRTA